MAIGAELAGGGDGLRAAEAERFGSNLGSKRGSYLAILARGGPRPRPRAEAHDAGGGGGCGCSGGD